MEERFWSKVEKSPTCWNWTGAKSNTGYGHINAGGSYLGAHRVAYELIKGPIPAGKQIDHLYIRPDGKGRGCRACRRECNARRYLPDA